MRRVRFSVAMSPDGSMDSVAGVRRGRTRRFALLLALSMALAIPGRAVSSTEEGPVFETIEDETCKVATPGYDDTNNSVLGSDTYTPAVSPPDEYKRHVYGAEARVANGQGRREIPN